MANTLRTWKTTLPNYEKFNQTYFHYTFSNNGINEVNPSPYLSQSIGQFSHFLFSTLSKNWMLSVSAKTNHATQFQWQINNSQYYIDTRTVNFIDSLQSIYLFNLVDLSSIVDWNTANSAKRLQTVFKIIHFCTNEGSIFSSVLTASSLSPEGACFLLPRCKTRLPRWINSIQANSVGNQPSDLFGNVSIYSCHFNL